MITISLDIFMLKQPKKPLDNGGISNAFLYILVFKLRTFLVHRNGSCLNCGECCKTLFHNSQRSICQYFDGSTVKHCTIYGTRPKVCRDFPRNPMDQERLSNCGFWFTNEMGRIIDGYMDKRIRLTKIGEIKR